jgi:hypothetical protein
MKTELETLQEQLKEIEAELDAKYKAIGELNEKIEAINLQAFEESGVLGEIKWKIMIGNGDTVYLQPIGVDYDKWAKRVFKLYKGHGFNHYSIPMYDCTLKVNDYDLHLEANDGVGMADVILRHGLIIASSDVEVKRKEMEEKLAALGELDDALKSSSRKVKRTKKKDSV